MNPMLGIMSSAGGLSASLVGDQIEHGRIRAGGDCTAGVSLNSSGIEYAYSNSGSPIGTNLGTWLHAGNNTNFWARCTLNSGSLDAANSGVGSWLALSTTRSWAIIRDTIGTDTADIDIAIATDSGGANIVVANTNYTLSASEEA